MATLNVRDFPDKLLKELRDKARTAGMTFRGWLILTLEGKRVMVTSARDLEVAPRSPARALDLDTGQEVEFDYSDVPFEDCPVQEQRRRKVAAEEAARARKNLQGMVQSGLLKRGSDLEK